MIARPAPTGSGWTAARGPAVSLLGRSLDFDLAAVAQLGKTARAPGLLGRLLFPFALFLALDAQRRYRPRQQTPERDRLAAVLADVDLIGIQPGDLLVDLAKQELLAVVEAHLGREQLFLHRFVDRIAADVPLVVHRI